MKLNKPIPIGTKTKFGTVQGYRFDGERYYFLIDDKGTASYLPADVVENEGGGE